MLANVLGICALNNFLQLIHVCKICLGSDLHELVDTLK